MLLMSLIEPCSDTEQLKASEWSPYQAQMCYSMSCFGQKVTERI